MSVAVYNHYKRLYNNLPTTSTTKSQSNTHEPIQGGNSQISNQQQSNKISKLSICRISSNGDIKKSTNLINKFHSHIACIFVFFLHI